MTSLQDILFSIRTLTQKIISNGGEVSNDDERELDLFKEQLPQKVDKYNYILDEMENRIAYTKEKENEWKKERQITEKAYEWLKDNAKDGLVRNGLTVLTGVDSQISLRNSRARLEIDESRIPDAFTMQVTETVIDKERIRKALESGETIEGARLVETFALHRGIKK